MAEITATMVKSLRDRSGLPMMDCKNALAEAGGDQDKAMDVLRRSGVAAAEKRADRTMAEGRISSYVDSEKNVAGMAEVLCETAPVSNNPDFIELANKVAKHAALSGDASIDTIGQEKFADDSNVTVDEMLKEILNRIRENMKITRVVRATGRVSVYIHHNARVGVMLMVDGDGGSTELLNDVCMHIAAMSPEALSREQMPADEVEKEQQIVKEQIIASGKPENLVEKISIGKMNKWYGDRVLLEQPFVKDDKKTVGKVLEEGGAKVTNFVRWQVGEV